VVLKNSPEQRAANGRQTRQHPFQQKRAMPKTPRQKPLPPAGPLNYSRFRQHAVNKITATIFKKWQITT
jgi:hypothetical protein